jgi:hypothetical protein
LLSASSGRYHLGDPAKGISCLSYGLCISWYRRGSPLRGFLFILSLLHHWATDHATEDIPHVGPAIPLLWLLQVADCLGELIHCICLTLSATFPAHGHLTSTEPGSCPLLQGHTTAKTLWRSTR